MGSGENKSKRYDRISMEIKNLENKSELERVKIKKIIEQLTKRINDKELSKKNENGKEKGEEIQDYELFEDKLNLQSKKMILMDLERDKKFNYIDVIQKLKIAPEQRTIRDIIRIKTYMEQSNLGKSFYNEFSDINLIEKLINFCCIEMRYVKFEKGDVIYRIGEPPNSFYSIIFGKANVLKPVEKKISLTGFQYFNYLMKLRKNKDHYIFDLCIKNNKINFFIEPIHSDMIHYIYLNNYLEHIKDRNNIKIELDKILDLIGVKPEEIGLDSSLINSDSYILNNIKTIKRKIPPISEVTMQKYSFINNYQIQKEVAIFEYKKIAVLNFNDYFGDNAIEHHTIRDTTVVAEEDIEAAYLPNKLYYSQIASLKTVVLENKISILHSCYFFTRINYSKFAKKYYKLFINEKYSKGEVVFNEGEEIKYLYFIQEGNVELFTSKSMNEIETLINILIKKKSENRKESKDNNNYLYSQLNSERNDLADYVNQKQNNKLIILNKHEDIGAVSYYLGNNYLTSCNVISNTLKVYKIDIKDLNEILRREYECKEEFIKRMQKKLGLLTERLFKINNIKLIMTDEKINNEKIDKQKIEEQNKQKILNNTNSSKALIDYNKINNLLTDNINMINYSKSKYKSNKINLPVLKSGKKIDYSFFINGDDEINCSSIFRRNKNKSRLNSNNNDTSRNNGNNSKIKKLKINMDYIFEDKIIRKINKHIKYLTESKYTLTKRRKINNSLFNENKNNQSFKTKNDDSYCSNINLIKTTKNEDKDKDKEVFNQSNINTINNKISISTQIMKETNVSNSCEKGSQMPYIAKNNTYNKTNIKDLNLFESRIRNKKKAKYNFPYCESITLLKKEKYKIFDSSDKNKVFQSELMKMHTKRIIDLRQLHYTIKKNPISINYGYINKK
jgi:CRP-like cAMP-binding protein